MASATSAIHICQLAASFFGEEVANIVSPTAPVEKLCLKWYDIVRQMCLRTGLWNFASARATLSRDSTWDPDDEEEWADAYRLPNNFLRLRFIGNDQGRDEKQEYELESRKILIDNGGEDDLRIGYVKDEENVSLFDPLFKVYLAVSLGLCISGGLKKQVGPQQYKIFTEWKETLESVASSIDGQERPPLRVESSRVLNKRYGGSGILKDNRYIQYS